MKYSMFCDHTYVFCYSTFSLQELKSASLEDLVSWLEKAKTEGHPTQKLEKWLLHKCCYEGVCY